MPTPATIYCRTCSYNLHGLPENRCPECGNTFDPTNRKTFRRRPQRGVWRWVRRGTVLLLVLLLAYGGLIGWLWWGWRAEQPAIAALRAAHLTTTPLGNALQLKSWPLYHPVIRRLLPARGLCLLDRVETVWASDTMANADLAKIASFRQLRILTLYRAEGVTDEGLASLANLNELEIMQIRGARVRGPGLTHLGGLRKLGTLELNVSANGCELSGRSLVHLAPLTGLARLSLDPVKLRKGDLDSLAGLANLQALDLRLVPAEEVDLVPLTGLNKLAELTLSGCILTDRGAADLARLSSLQWLGLDGDDLRVGEAGIAGLQHLGNLHSVFIRNAKNSRLSPDQIKRAFPNATIDYFPSSPTTWPTTAPATNN